jgi:hypothetical protein
MRSVVAETDRVVSIVFLAMCDFLSYAAYILVTCMFRLHQYGTLLGVLCTSCSSRNDMEAFWHCGKSESFVELRTI